jgi:hypothetical protein
MNKILYSIVINHNKPENKETWVVVKFAFKKTTKRKNS